MHANAIVTKIENKRAIRTNTATRLTALSAEKQIELDLLMPPKKVDLVAVERLQATIRNTTFKFFIPIAIARINAHQMP